MRLIHCACGASLIDDSLTAEQFTLPELPTQKDLKFLDRIAREVLPEDPTPSLDEIQRNPAVAHLGAPNFAPQRPSEPLRIIVSGSDRALGLVLTRLMRADTMWAEVAYLPVDPQSPAAVLWGAGSVDLAVSGPVRPIPCIRTDFGEVVAGSAELFTGDGGGRYIGEVVVDSDVLVSPEKEYGARLVPTVDAPGIAAVPYVTPVVDKRRFFRRTPRLDGTRALTGRALQSGGNEIAVRIDDHLRPRPVNRVTFYRHLRDIQAVRGS